MTLEARVTQAHEGSQSHKAKIEQVSNPTQVSNTQNIPSPPPQAAGIKIRQNNF